MPSSSLLGYLWVAGGRGRIQAKRLRPAAQAGKRQRREEEEV